MGTRERMIMDLCTILLGGTRARLGLVEDARLINNKLSLGQQQLFMYLNDYNFRRRSWKPTKRWPWTRSGPIDDYQYDGKYILMLEILKDLIKNSIDLEQGVGPLMIVNYILPCKSKTNLKSKTVFTLNEEWVQHMSLWDAGRLPFTWTFIWMIVIMVTTPIVIWKSGWSSLYDTPALQFPFSRSEGPLFFK